MSFVKSLMRRARSARFRDVGATTVVDCLMMATQLFTGIIVGRVLGPTGRGEFALIILWPAFVSGLLVGGVRFSVIYHISRGIGRLPDLIATATMVMFAGSSVAGLLLVMFVDGWLADASRECRDLLILLSLTLPLSSIGALLEPVLLGRREYKVWNLSRLLDPLVMAGFVVLFASLGRLSVTVLVYVYLGIRVAFTSWFLVYLAIRLRAERVERASTDLLVYGAKCMPSGWLGNVNAQADQMILSTLFSPMYLGLYRTGANVASFMRFVSMGFQRLVMTESADAKDESDRIDRIASYLVSCAIVAAVCLVPFLIVLGPAIRILYGEEFGDSIAPARILVFAVVLRGFSGILANGFRGLGQPLMPLWADISGTVILIVCFILLIPSLSIIGAAISVLISSACIFAVLGAAFLRLAWSHRRSRDPETTVELA